MRHGAVEVFGTDPGLPTEPFWTPSKVISASIVSVYVFLALVILGPADSLEVLVACAVPILAIWTPEMLGGYEGLGFLHGRPVSKSSPPEIIRWLGWMTLLLPPVLLLIAMR